jgi:hypothetical protein
MNTLMFVTATIHIIQLAKSFFLNALTQFDIETGVPNMSWFLSTTNKTFFIAIDFQVEMSICVDSRARTNTPTNDAACIVSSVPDASRYSTFDNPSNI